MRLTDSPPPNNALQIHLYPPTTSSSSSVIIFTPSPSTTTTTIVGGGISVSIGVPPPHAWAAPPLTTTSTIPTDKLSNSTSTLSNLNPHPNRTAFHTRIDAGGGSAESPSRSSSSPPQLHLPMFNTSHHDYVCGRTVHHLGRSCWDANANFITNAMVQPPFPLPLPSNFASCAPYTGHSPTTTTTTKHEQKRHCPHGILKTRKPGADVPATNHRSRHPTFLVPVMADHTIHTAPIDNDHHVHSDKFVTRKEYDEIKDSLNRLQSILSNQSPSATTDPVEVAAVLNAVQSRASTVFAKMAGPGVPANNSSGTNTNTNANTNANTNVNKNKRTGSGGGTADPFMPMPPPPPLEGGGGRSNASSGSPPPSLSYPLSRPSRRSYSEAAAPSTALGSTSAATQSYAMGVPSQTVFPSPTNPFGVGMSVGVIQGYDDDRDDFLSHPTPQSTHFIPGSGPRKGSVSVATAVPEIHLGGLIVDDQSPTALVHPGMYNLNKLDALAKAAHSSPRSGLGMPMGSVDVDGRPASSSSKVTLAPIHANGLSPEVNGSSSTTGRFSPAPGVSMVMGGVGGRDSMSSKESEMRRVLETCLPRKEVCDRLVAHYFELVEWSITLLHYSRFMRTYQAFWLLSESERARLALCSLSPMQRGNSSGGGAGVRWGEGFRASFVPPPHATSADGTTAETPGSVGVNSNRTRTRDEASVVRSSWVALLFAVMCVALERMGFYDSKAIGINTVNEYHRQCRLLYDASQSVLVLSDFLKSSSLETIQTLVLHTHCPQSLSTADWETQTSVTLGLAFRLGFLQGLHKLMPEKMGSARTPGLLIREMGRRAWWNLIETDWRLSTRVGNTYVLHPNQNNCDLPANLEWEDLERARATFVQRERSVWTGASSLLARIDLALVRRELVDKYNAVDGVTYAQLAEHEKRLEEMVHRAPRQLFNIDGDFESQTPQGQWDRIQFTFLLNSDIIALHRPYLVTSLLEVKATGASPAVSQVTQYHRTLEISIRSAEAILDALEEAKATSYPGISWWQTSVQCHVAAVVLLIERWYTPEAKPGTLESEDADERKRKIVAAIGLLRDQGDSIEIFATAANALESLLDATTSARRKARRNARRAMDLNDVVNPVNSSRSQSAGNTPPFVRDWIERPNTPVPSSSESMVIIDRAPSLSTLSIFPGTPLVADTSYDSQFWSRIFDLEFVPPSEVREMYFPSVEIGEEDEGEMEGEAWTPTMQGVVHTEKAGERNTSLWQRTTTSKEGEEVEASSGTELGASAIWSSLSGPLGSLNADKEEWHRVTPYDLGGTTTTARG
ncbi:hypothetical protein FRC14_008065 [Serendipita sp. 396]|nr:hypothetical protein FRC14_008065 [Serendipita sp. 396]KAG8871581.1 hypothetical protein FRC20_010404 [Serendipita sp. 405]